MCTIILCLITTSNNKKHLNLEFKFKKIYKLILKIRQNFNFMVVSYPQLEKKKIKEEYHYLLIVIVFDIVQPP